MACRLHSSIIYLVVLLLVSALAYSWNDKSEGEDDIQRRLLQLLRGGEERRTMSDDTNAYGARATDQGNADRSADVPGISVENEGDGVRKLYITLDGENIQQIIQDCNSKYELIMMKADKNNGGGVCYLHTMNDKQYGASCNANGEKVDSKYEIGSQIEDKTLLSKMKGADECLKRPTYELRPISVKTGKRDNLIRMLAKRQCYCLSVSVCSTFCDYWYDGYCQRNQVECRTGCKYACY